MRKFGAMLCGLVSLFCLVFLLNFEYVSHNEWPKDQDPTKVIKRDTTTFGWKGSPWYQKETITVNNVVESEIGGFTLNSLCWPILALGTLSFIVCVRLERHGEPSQDNPANPPQTED